MPRYVAYFVPAAIILAIFIISNMATKKISSNTADANTAAPSDKKKGKAKQNRIYEAPGVDQESDHPLGAVQSVIGCRTMLLPLGVTLICIGFFCLNVLYRTERGLAFGNNSPIRLLLTLVLLEGIIRGLRFIAGIKNRIQLRRTGFEISNLLGTKSYTYNEVDFFIDHTIDFRDEPGAERPSGIRAGLYNFLWKCQIVFNDGRRSIMLNSSRYSSLKNKMHDVFDALYGR